MVPTSLWGEGSEKEQWPLPVLLSQRKLLPTLSSCLDARQFSSSLYVSGAFQAAAPVLEPKVSSSKFVYGPFKRNLLGLQKPSNSFSLTPHWFLQPDVRGTSFWSEGTWCGTGTCAPKGGPLQLSYPSQFLSGTFGCGTSPFCISTAPPPPAPSLDVAASVIP